MYENSEKEEDQETTSQAGIFKGFPNQQLDALSLLQEMHHQTAGDPYVGALGGGVGGGSTLTFPEGSQILPWTLPQVHSFDPAHHFPAAGRADDHDHQFLFPPPAPAPPLSYGGLFCRRGGAGLQFGYEGPSSSSELQMRQLFSESLSQMVHPSSAPFGLHAELQKMSAQEIMDAKALAASKSHSEAERRRRERINNHLAKLRSLLPSTTKTDKASLLAEVIQQVKELKHQTSLIAETSSVPTETDEVTVDNASDHHEDGKLLIKASICCDDRPELLPDLIKTLKVLRLKTLKAEITTLGGRVKNVLYITGSDQDDLIIDSNHDDEMQQQQQQQRSNNSTLSALFTKPLRRL